MDFASTHYIRTNELLGSKQGTNREYFKSWAYIPATIVHLNPSYVRQEIVQCAPTWIPRHWKPLQRINDLWDSKLRRIICVFVISWLIKIDEKHQCMKGYLSSVHGSRWYSRLLIESALFFIVIQCVLTCRRSSHKAFFMIPISSLIFLDIREDEVFRTVLKKVWYI